MRFPQMTMRFNRDAAPFHRTYIPFCLLCNRQYKHGETKHIGYLNDGRAIQVGDCCAHLLVETAIRQYVAVPEREIERPSSSTKLWRYMDLGKYVSMLS